MKSMLRLTALEARETPTGFGNPVPPVPPQAPPPSTPPGPEVPPPAPNPDPTIPPISVVG